MEQLGELSRLLDSTPQLRVKILAVSPDGPGDSQQLIEELTGVGGRFPIPLLADEEHRIIDRYGLRNRAGGSLPHPATFVIDTQGIVRWRFVEVNYRERPSNEDILQVLNQLL